MNAETAARCRQDAGADLSVVTAIQAKQRERFPSTLFC